MTIKQGGAGASLKASPEQTVKQIVAGLVSRLFRRNRQPAFWAEAVAQVIPASQPQVAAHQRKALKCAQLAAEIGWRGVRR